MGYALYTMGEEYCIEGRGRQKKCCYGKWESHVRYLWCIYLILIEEGKEMNDIRYVNT